MTRPLRRSVFRRSVVAFAVVCVLSIAVTWRILALASPLAPEWVDWPRFSFSVRRSRVVSDVNYEFSSGVQMTQHGIAVLDDLLVFDISTPTSKIRLEAVYTRDGPPLAWDWELPALFRVCPLRYLILVPSGKDEPRSGATRFAVHHDWKKQVAKGHKDWYWLMPLAAFMLVIAWPMLKLGHLYLRFAKRSTRGQSSPTNRSKRNPEADLLEDETSWFMDQAIMPLTDTADLPVHDDWEEMEQEKDAANDEEHAHEAHRRHDEPEGAARGVPAIVLQAHHALPQKKRARQHIQQPPTGKGRKHV